MRRSASMPSRSGRPRSSSTTSGRSSATSTSPSSAVGDSSTSNARALRLVRSARRSEVSSSITSTVVVIALAPSSSCITSGITNTNVAPPPGVSSHQTRPPCAVTRACTMARPRPVPLASGRASTRANSSKIRVRSSSGTPGPWSATRTSTSARRRSRAARHQDLRAGRREPQRVLEEVAEDLFHHLHVDLDVAQRRPGRRAAPGARAASGRSRRIAACARSRRSTGCRRTSSPPARMRLSSRMLVTSRSRRSVSS